MPSSSVTSRNQLNVLESGLRTIQHSQLMEMPHFKDMYTAVEKHHKNIRLGHLTGMSRDLLEQGKQDAQFYYILLKMLVEVQCSSNQDQVANLKMVYSWYNSNKHVLHSGPRFGKAKKKSTKQRNLTRAPVLRHAEHTCESTSDFSILEFLSSEVPNKAQTIQESETLDDVIVDKAVDEAKKEEESISSRNFAVRIPTIADECTNLPDKQQKEPTNSPLLPKRKAPPVSHVYNPMTKALDHMFASLKEMEAESRSSPVKVQIGSANKSVKPLHQWNTYTDSQSQGQYQLSVMQHLGRSGTPGSVRYTAHRQGLPAEDLTPNVLLGYASSQDSDHVAHVDQNMLTKKNLEDFYKLAENYYPAKLPKYPGLQLQTSAAKTDKSRIGSTCVEKYRISSARSAPASLEGSTDEPCTQVRLGTVMKLVDSVTEEMCYHKEKVAEEPRSGFRQPIVAVDPTTHENSDPTICNARPNSPSLSNYSGKTQLMEPVDWRGHITPDYTQSVSDKSVFGSHSYVQPTSRPMSHRSQGSTQAGARPKTAPLTVHQKWSTSRPSDDNVRPYQAASHVSTEVDQNTSQQLLTVHQLGGKTKTRRQRHTFHFKTDHFYPDPSPPEMEYLSIIAPMASALTESRASTATRSGTKTRDSGLPESYWSGWGTGTNPEEFQQDGDSTAAEHDMCDPHEVDYDLDQLSDQDVKFVDEGQSILRNTPENLLGSLAESRQLLKEVQLLLNNEPDSRKEAEMKVWDLDRGDMGERINSSKKGILKSNLPAQWNLSREDHCEDMMSLLDEEVDRYMHIHEKAKVTGARQQTQLTDAYRRKSFKRMSKHRPPATTIDNDPSLMSVQGRTRNSRGRVRSAGSVPLRAKSTTHAQMLQRQKEMLHRAPVRARNTPPSIPSSSSQWNSRLEHPSVPFIQELESHARRDEHPRRYMEKVGLLRKHVSHSPVLDNFNCNEDLEMTLQVNRIVPAVFVQRNIDTPDGISQGHPGTPVNSLDPDPSLPDSEKLYEDEPRSRAMTPCRRLVDEGRPIAHYFKVEDPDDYAASVQRHKEVSAAVDIQRIFRGFAARNHYKYLQKEEREKREDQRKAAVEIQRHYRGHLARKRAIRCRSPNLEILEWARNYRLHLQGQETRRRVKAECDQQVIASENARSSAKRTIIGPHVYIYDSFHPKKIGGNKELLDKAATIIQRWTRGFLVRQKMKMVRRKARIHAASWGRFVEHYKEMLKRIQSRHGNERPPAPFDFVNVNEYMDLKKRYESVFEKRAFGGELEFEELAAYFNECELYPARMDIDNAISLVFRGQPESKGLSKHDVMEVTFQLYPPKATGITNQHRSTWLSPVVDGEEALKLKGSEIVEPTNFETCWKMVAASKHARHAKEEAESKKLKEEEEDRQINEWESKRKKQTSKQTSSKSHPQSTITENVKLSVSTNIDRCSDNLKK